MGTTNMNTPLLNNSSTNMWTNASLLWQKSYIPGLNYDFSNMFLLLDYSKIPLNTNNLGASYTSSLGVTTPLYTTTTTTNTSTTNKNDSTTLKKSGSNILSSMGGGMFSGIGSAIEGVVNQGASNTAGNLLNSAGDIASNFGPWGMLAGGVLRTAGLIVNGTTNNVNKEYLLAKNKEINSALGKTNASSYEELVADAHNINNVANNIDLGDLKNWGSKGFLHSEAGSKRKRARTAAELALSAVRANNNARITLLANNINKTNTMNQMENLAAFGGPFDVSGPIEYAAMNSPRHGMGNPGYNYGYSINSFIDLGNINAFGGGIEGNGSNFTTGLTHIDTGDTHETNPNEGVLVGVDNQGTPNLVEEGEVIYNDYVFSKRLIVPELKIAKGEKATLSLKLLNRYKGLSYADAAKKLEKNCGLDERPNDAIAKRGYESMLEILALSLEKEREKKKLKDLEALIDNMTPEELQQYQALLNGQQDEELSLQGQYLIKRDEQGRTPQQVELQLRILALQLAQMQAQQQQMALQLLQQGLPSPEEMQQGMPPLGMPPQGLPLMAYGGRIYAEGGLITPEQLLAMLAMQQAQESVPTEGEENVPVELDVEPTDMPETEEAPKEEPFSTDTPAEEMSTTLLNETIDLIYQYAKEHDMKDLAKRARRVKRSSREDKEDFVDDAIEEIQVKQQQESELLQEAESEENPELSEEEIAAMELDLAGTSMSDAALELAAAAELNSDMQLTPMPMLFAMGGLTNQDAMLDLFMESVAQQLPEVKEVYALYLQLKQLGRVDEARQLAISVYKSLLQLLAQTAQTASTLQFAFGGRVNRYDYGSWLKLNFGDELLNPEFSRYLEAIYDYYLNKDNADINFDLIFLGNNPLINPALYNAIKAANLNGNKFTALNDKNWRTIYLNYLGDLKKAADAIASARERLLNGTLTRAERSALADLDKTYKKKTGYKVKDLTGYSRTMYENDRLKVLMDETHNINSSNLEISNFSTRKTKEEDRLADLDLFATGIARTLFLTQKGIVPMQLNKNNKFDRTYTDAKGKPIRSELKGISVINNMPTWNKDKKLWELNGTKVDVDYAKTDNGFQGYTKGGTRDWSTYGYYDKDNVWHDVALPTNDSNGNSDRRYVKQGQWFTGSKMNVDDYEGSDQYLNNYIDFVDAIGAGDKSALQRLWRLGNISKDVNGKNRYFNDDVTEDNVSLSNIRSLDDGASYVIGDSYLSNLGKKKTDKGTYKLNNTLYINNKTGNIIGEGSYNELSDKDKKDFTATTEITRDLYKNYLKHIRNKYVGNDSGEWRASNDDLLWLAMFDSHPGLAYLESKVSGPSANRYALMNSKGEYIDATGKVLELGLAPVYVNYDKDNPFYTLSNNGATIMDDIYDKGTTVHTYGVLAGNNDVYMTKIGNQYFQLTPDLAKLLLESLDLTGYPEFELQLPGYTGNVKWYDWDDSKLGFDDKGVHLKGTTNTIDEGPEFPTYSSWPGIAALGINGLMLAHNLIAPKDYSNADALINAARNAGDYSPIGFKPVGEYVRYNPYDINYVNNQARNNNLAMLSSIKNNSNGNTGSLLAGMLALNYNYGLGIGNNYRQAMEYNDKQKLDVAKFNRETDEFNSEGFLKAAMANLDARMKANQSMMTGLASGYAMRQAIDDARANAINGNINSLVAGLNTLNQNDWQNKLLGWSTYHNGYPGIESAYTKAARLKATTAEGGRIRRNNRGINF